MKKIEIILNKGESNERIVVMHAPKARAVRDAIDLQEEVFVKDAIDTSEKLDGVLSRVVTYYEDLTVDDIYDGLDSDELLLFIRDTIDFIIAGTTRRVSKKNVTAVEDKA